MTAPIVLASGSPRRRQLLEMLRIPFRVIAPDVDEHVLHVFGGRVHLEQLVPADEIAQREFSIFLCQRNENSVLREHDLRRIVVAELERAQFFAGFNVPLAQHTIVAGRDHSSAIVREDDSHGGAIGTAEFANLGAGLD